MKYMGSKRSMLQNGLGHAIEEELDGAERFVDMFTGSGSVAHHVATRWPIKVIATDLQAFAVALADAVVGRDSRLSSLEFLNWIRRANVSIREHPHRETAKRLDSIFAADPTYASVVEIRAACCLEGAGPIQRAYGGHYFSFYQALKLDCLRATLPTHPAHQKVALAAIIETASACAAAPGHTAQPFQPTATAMPFLAEAWARNPVKCAWRSVNKINSSHAKVLGESRVRDAIDTASILKPGDVVFIDPPYSSVHYSRFYHVLETITHGCHVDVSGVGRYPAPEERPRSLFSMKSTARSAFDDLLRKTAEGGARAIITFPSGQASNQVSGNDVIATAKEYFTIEEATVTGRFSTLGGNLVNRNARAVSRELILRLKPR